MPIVGIRAASKSNFSLVARPAPGLLTVEEVAIFSGNVSIRAFRRWMVGTAANVIQVHDE